MSASNFTLEQRQLFAERLLAGEPDLSRLYGALGLPDPSGEATACICVAIAQIAQAAGRASEPMPLLSQLFVQMVGILGCTEEVLAGIAARMAEKSSP